LGSSWKSLELTYSSAVKKLTEKKELLFTQRRIDHWHLKDKCTYTVETLLTNKVIAFTEMLPDETQEIVKMEEKLGYYSNTLLEEYQRVSGENNKNFRASLAEVVTTRCRTFELVRL